MNIVCPNCAASYQVGAAAIGAEGRSVRCVRCRTVWFEKPRAEVPPLVMSAGPSPVQEPASDATVAAFQAELGNEIRPPAAGGAPQPQPTQDAAVAAAAPATPAAEPVATSVADNPPQTSAGDAPPAEDATEPPPGMALSEITLPATEAPPVVPEDAAPSVDDGKPIDIESTAARRKARSHPRRRLPTRAGRLPALILILACVCAALIGWRGTIVRHAPQMASLYAAIGLPVNLRGLVFSDVKVSKDVHDGVPILLVEGVITSTASKPVEVPRLRFAMRNEVGGEVYAWTAMPSREVLGPGETLPFRSRLASPPGDGRDVMVRFFTRLDAVAGLR